MSAAPAVSTSNYDLFAPSVLEDPTELLTRLRAENPLYYSPQLHGYVLTRYDDIVMVLKDPDMGSAMLTGWIDQMPQLAQEQLQPLRASLDLWMGHKNNDDHQRIQRVLRRYLTLATVESLRPRVESLVTSLFDAVEGKTEVDIIQDIANPLPCNIIGELLGVPQEDRDQLQQWSQQALNLFRIADLPTLLETQKAILAIQDYMKPIVEARRHTPLDDLPSLLATAQAEGQMKSDAEILGNCVALMFGGHETTVYLIANTLLALMQNPEQFQMVKDRPELIPSAVEETLRYDGPVDLITRVTPKPLRLVGGEVPANSMLILMLRAGSRDPALYANPDRFDITRPTTVRSLAFGLGSFYCLGTALARMETQICLREFLHRMPNIRPLFDVNKPDYRPLPPIRRRLETLRVAR